MKGTFKDIQPPNIMIFEKVGGEIIIISGPGINDGRTD